VVNRASHLVMDENPDVVVVAGDLANRDLQAAEHIVRELSKMAPRVFFVPGNMDNPVLADWTGTDRITCLHGKKVIHDGVSFIGLGGAVTGPCWDPFEYDEAEAGRILGNAIGSGSPYPLVLVSHCPPKGTKLDLAFGHWHVGSKVVREFIEEREPVLVICGHIHEAQGIDEIGRTLIVNVGAVAHGHYASISLEKQVKIELRKL